MCARSVGGEGRAYACNAGAANENVTHLSHLRMGGEHAFESDAGIGCHRVVDHDAVGYLASDEDSSVHAR